MALKIITKDKQRPPKASVRIYRADAIECNCCDNWEEGSKPWSEFQWHECQWESTEGCTETGYWTCNNCGSDLVKCSEIEEFRDYE